MMKMKLHFVAGEQAWRHLFFTALCPDGWQTHCCHSGGQELEENGRWRTVRLVPQVMCCPQGNVADGPLVDPVTNELALHWWRHHTLVYLLNVRRNFQKNVQQNAISFIMPPSVPIRLSTPPPLLTLSLSSFVVYCSYLP